ncbi:MAG: tetratricopeptide repeat protein [Moorea sp. SIO4A3]|nr:tetratricopeptide repeat protein [Moorena sp. SIO4A3]
MTLPPLAQEQNTVSPEQEGNLAPRDAIVQVAINQAEADKLFKQGLSHLRRSKFPEGLESWQQALVIYNQIRNRKSEAKSLGNLGLAYYHVGDYKKAIDYYQNSLAIHREIGDHKGEANSLTNLGLAYKNLGQYQKAIDYYQNSLAIKKKIGDRLGEACSLTNLGLAYDNLGEYNKAIDYHQNSLAIARAIGYREGEVNSLNNLGGAYGYLEELKKAIDYLEQSLNIARKIGYRKGEAMSLHNLRNVYFNLGDYKKAIDYYQQSIAIKRKIGDRLGQANSLNNLGSAYGHLGDYSKAIDYYQQSIAIKRKIGDRNGEAASLNNLGSAYGHLGDYQKAIDHYQKSLVIDRDIGDRNGEAASLNNLGSAYRHVGDYKKAINYYQGSLAIARDIGDRLGEAYSLGNLGNVYINLGDYFKGIDYHQDSLAIQREIGDRLGEANSLIGLGIIYDNLGKYKKAIDYQQNSLAIAREIGNRKGEASSLNNIGATFLKKNHLKQAQTHVFDAIKIWEDIRQDLGNEDDWKISIFEQQSRSYRLLQQVLVAQGKPKQALEISERGRNRALIDLLAAQLSETTQKTKAPTLKDIQEIAKQQQATLVEYSIVDDQIYIWVIAPTGEITFRSNTLPQDTTLAELVKVSRLQIGVRGRGNQNPASPPNPNNSNPLQELYQVLITPIVDLLPEKESDRIIFIPHHSLFLVPFAALLDDNHKYLIENHTILTAPSIQSLSFTRKNWHRVQDSNGTPLIVGNPTMPSIIGEEQKPLDSLPGAETEALTIAQLLNTTAVIGPLATESTIVEKMANASLIHLATHGLVDGIYYRGAIALAPDEPDHDGFLTSDEILIGYGLPEKSLLNAKLVVLSACDTGRGEIKGEGVVGLSRSLIAAGVPSLVVSLWQVPDDDTVKLMTEFYTNIYTHKMDKAKAMREAMLSMINDGDGNPDPKAWAAFTVIGEAR